MRTKGDRRRRFCEYWQHIWRGIITDQSKTGKLLSFWHNTLEGKIWRLRSAMPRIKELTLCFFFSASCVWVWFFFSFSSNAVRSVEIPWKTVTKRAESISAKTPVDIGTLYDTLITISKITAFRRVLSSYKLANVLSLEWKVKIWVLSQQFPKSNNHNDRRDFGTSRRNFRCSISKHCRKSF